MSTSTSDPVRPGEQGSTSWDDRAVPTITADSDLGACFGFGHAQAVAHARDVLEAYGIARGDAARLWGPAFTAADVEHAQLGLDEHIGQWAAGQDEATLRRLQAFCDGFNAACQQHPGRGGDRRQVLPVHPRDVVGHVLKVFLGFARFWDDGLAFARPPGGLLGGGSSAWAVGAQASATGETMLLANPHLPWAGPYRLFEARTVSPGRSCHGVTPLGFPWQTFGYTPHLAWTHTVNPLPQLWVYALELDHVTPYGADGADGAGEGGAVAQSYRYDGRSRPFTLTRRTVEVLGEQPVTVVQRSSVHGPVVTAPDGATVAVRVAGVLHAPATDCLSTWWRMSSCTSVRELLTVTQEQPLPLFNVLAADDSGSVTATFCGITPHRPGGDFDDHRRRLPGDDPAQLWHEVNPQAGLPRVVDPPCGWVQNANETPWWFCEPPLDPLEHPDGIAPDPRYLRDIRSTVSREHLRELTQISPADLLALKWQTRVRLADVVLPDLLEAASNHLDLAGAVNALRGWDRHADTDSSGYPLFHLWAHDHLPLAAPLMDGSHLVLSAAPGELPTGLVDPDEAVAALRRAQTTLGERGHPLDVTYGTFARVGAEPTNGNGDGDGDGDGGGGDPGVGASGAPSYLGVLKCLEVAPAESGWHGIGGDTWTCLIRFTPDGPQAQAVLLPGGPTEQRAPAGTSQLPAWRTNTLLPLPPLPSR